MNDVDGAEVDLSPDPEVLSHLHALVERLGLQTASRLGPRSAAEAHRLATGHRLSFGCCRQGSEAVERASDELVDRSV